MIVRPYKFDLKLYQQSRVKIVDFINDDEKYVLYPPEDKGVSNKLFKFLSCLGTRNEFCSDESKFVYNEIKQCCF